MKPVLPSTPKGDIAGERVPDVQNTNRTLSTIGGHLPKLPQKVNQKAYFIHGTHIKHLRGAGKEKKK